MSLCFCAAIPQIENRTDVLILQHVGERFHPFNTARIVRQALRRCELVVDHNRRLATHSLPIQANSGLLYPQADAPSLDDVDPDQRPSQLVIIDGTWHQAKTIVRDVPQLCALPCYRLSPTTPGQYRIRREPNAHSLSTLEAVVAALKVLEPDTTGLDKLVSAFTQMVETQLSHPAGHAAWRRNAKRQPQPRHLPHALLGDAQRLVVAYGESTPGHPGRRRTIPMPVNWVARRLGTTESFSCCVEHPTPLAEGDLRHMQLSATDVAAAVSHSEFRERWRHFLRSGDVLIVYHQKTYQLLQNMEASQPRCLVLKAIFGKRQSGFRSLEELITAEGLTLTPAPNANRAHRRLAMAVVLVNHLRATAS